MAIWSFPLFFKFVHEPNFDFPHFTAIDFAVFVFAHNFTEFTLFVQIVVHVFYDFDLHLAYRRPLSRPVGESAHDTLVHAWLKRLYLPFSD